MDQLDKKGAGWKIERGEKGTEQLSSFTDSEFLLKGQTVKSLNIFRKIIKSVPQCEIHS